MDASYEHIVLADASFAYRVYDLRAFPFRWHFHPEHELTLISSGSGRRFVGDHAGEFGPGDLVLVGPELPHSWVSHAGDGGERAVAVVVQFRRDFLGQAFLARPELEPVRRLLDRSARGLVFPGPAADAVRERLPGMAELDELGRLLELIGLLAHLARLPGEELAGPGYRPAVRDTERRRMEAVCAFVDEHHARPLRLEEIARVAHMTPAAFSRAFRHATGDTFTSYLAGVRVGAAARLLLETDLPVATVAARVGFHSLASFNRRFRALRGVSPREYRRGHAAAPR